MIMPEKLPLGCRGAWVVVVGVVVPLQRVGLFATLFQIPMDGRGPHLGPHYGLSSRRQLKWGQPRNQRMGDAGWTRQSDDVSSLQRGPALATLSLPGPSWTKGAQWHLPASLS